ncbi:unnamed protein product [Brachionus calyciflorus]|uniref:CCR4-NOT transcription complex subunit 10 n=1 Tax=Brachionus calyciflorus TaxID=104777 RepID=A0A813NTC7_9BILA|nr:unnamed protein product [Brachionus calyciflorus]
MSAEENSESIDGSSKSELNFNDHEKDWLVQAEDNYNKKKYDACLKCIQNLQQSFQKNYQASKIYTNLETKLSMNKSLCDLAISNFENLNEFKQDLNRICSQIKLDLSEPDTLEDLQHSFIFYNYSILLYYNKQYSSAFKIIDKLYYQFSELLDEKLFKEINFIFIDILIRLKKPLKALVLLQNYKNFNRRHSSSSLLSQKTSEEKNEEKNLEGESDISDSELISMFKLKCYFMVNSWKLFEKELKNHNNSSSLQHYKALEFYLLNDYSACFKSLISGFKNKLKSNPKLVQQFNELINNENKLDILGSNSITNDFCLKLVSICTNLTTSLNGQIIKPKTNEFHNHVMNTYSSILFLNNLALVHFSLKKYSLSTFYLKKSLSENLKFVEKYLQPSSVSTQPESKSKKKSKSKSEPDREEIDDSKNVKILNLSEHLMNHQFEIMYNLGISLLFNKQPLAAFESLYKLIEQYNQNARLWLRLAECCITCYRHSLSSDSSQFIKVNATLSGNEKIFKLGEKIKCIKKSFGSGFHHKIQIGSFITPDVNIDGLTINDFKDEEKLNKLITLEFAYLSLKNALNLIPTNQEIFSNDQGQNILKSKLSNQNETMDDIVDSDYDLNNDNDINEGSPNSQRVKRNFYQKFFNCVYPSKPINLAELQNLRCSILISLSYVSLCLRDYSSTVNYCKVLLSKDDKLNLKYPISRGNRLLAHSYLAEALLYLDKISDSIEHLNINAKLETENDMSFIPTVASENDPNDINDSFKNSVENNFRNHQAEWFPKDISTIRAISYYNLSVAHAIRGESETSYKHFNTSVQIFDKHKKHPAHAFLMKMYLDLLDGNRQSLQMVLKDHFPQTTLNRPIINMNNLNLNPNQKIQQLAQAQQQQLQNQQQNANQLPQNLAFLQLQQQQLQIQQLQMQQLQHQLQQQQQQQQQIQQLPGQQSLQNISQFLNNPNNLLMNSFGNSNQTNANLVGLPPALSPFNQTQNNLTNLMGQPSSTNGANLGNPFANLSNGNNLLSTLAAAASVAGNNPNTPVSQLAQQGLLNQNQLSLNPLLLQQQQAQGVGFLSQNQLPNRIS